MFNRIVDASKKIISSSEITGLLSNLKNSYKTLHGTENCGKIQSLFLAAKKTGKDFGIVNSVFAGIGALFGTVAIPVPGGAIIGAEGMVKLSKLGCKYGKTIGKKIAAFA